MNIPTDEQIDRACLLLSKALNRPFDEETQAERLNWRVHTRSLLILMMNRDFIDRGIGGPEEAGR